MLKDNFVRHFLIHMYSKVLGHFVHQKLMFAIHAHCANTVTIIDDIFIRIRDGAYCIGINFTKL